MDKYVTTTIERMGEINVWKRLPGTYEGGKMLKVVPEDRRDSTYVMVGGQNAESAARLIAAAPALLKALEEALRWLDVADRFKYPDGFRQGQAPSDARNRARAALAQARGTDHA